MPPQTSRPLAAQVRNTSPRILLSVSFHFYFLFTDGYPSSTTIAKFYHRFAFSNSSSFRYHYEGLPSEPVDLAVTTVPSTVGKVTMSWSPPEDAGGRSDLTYHVTCERCDDSGCVPCEDRVRYEPGSTDLTDTSVLVSQLEPSVNYTFSVEARSGVSQFSNQRALSSITTSLHYTGEEPDPISFASHNAVFTSHLFIHQVLLSTATYHIVQMHILSSVYVFTGY